MAATVPGIRRAIVVHRSKFKLVLWTRVPLTSKLRPWKTIDIAVGKDGYDTPSGLYLVSSRKLNPSWTVPQGVDWEPEEMWGKTIPAGDPANPLRGAWLGVIPDQAIGIHGTSNPESIPGRASHGCIRVREADARLLYRKVPMDTPVFII